MSGSAATSEEGNLTPCQRQASDQGGRSEPTVTSTAVSNARRTF